MNMNYSLRDVPTYYVGNIFLFSFANLFFSEHVLFYTPLNQTLDPV